MGWALEEFDDAIKASALDTARERWGNARVETTYDTLGRAVAERNQAAQVKGLAYDTLGRLTKVTPNTAEPTVYWTYAYDSAENMISQTDALGRVTHFEYDIQNRRTKRILPLGQQEIYTYNVGGQLTQKTNFNGDAFNYVYDSVGRLSSRNFPGRTVSFQYDAMGRRTQMQDGWGTTAYQYDGRGRLTQKSSPNGVLNYSYDNAGNMLSVQSTTANGVNSAFLYDDLNRLAQVQDLRSGAGNTAYTFDNAGNLNTVSYPNGVSHAYTYDDLNRLTSLNQAKSASTQASYAYTLRADGLRTQMVEGSGRTSVWAYDALYRVTNESITGAPVSGVTNFTYDAVNRLSRNSTVAGVSTYMITNDSNDHRSDQAYNPNGAVTGANGQTFDYDAEDRLIASPSAGVTLTYDGDGNLVQKVAGGHIYTYLVDSNNLTGFAQIVEIKKDGALAQVFNYGPSGVISQSDIASGQTRYFGKDGSNNTRYLTDASGAVTDSFDYSVDGILVGRTGTTLTFHMFQGEYFDADLGLYWLKARWMNPQSGTFMGPDTYEGQQEDPASLHKYAFTGWDGGINRTDPSGQTYFTMSNVMATVSVISVLSSSYSATRALQQGNYREAALNVAFLALDFTGVGIIEKAFRRLGLAGTKAFRGSIEAYTAWGKRNFMIRHLYKARFGQAKETVEALAKSGAKIEDVAKEAHRLRRAAQAEAQALMTAEEVAELQAWNIGQGFAKDGATLEQLYAKYGQDWLKVIDGSFRSNKEVDMLFLIFY